MNTRRFYALDILRTWCILMMTFYHVWENAFGQRQMPFKPTESLYGLATEFFLNYWSYAGVILTFISFFLIGYSKKKLNWPRFILIALGFIGMTTYSGIDITNPATWEWNLYAYLLVSLVFVQFIPRNPYVLSLLSVVSVILLLIPIDKFQYFKESLGEIAGQVLVGDLHPDKTVGWGLIPWLAIPILGFCIGRCLQLKELNRWVSQGYKHEISLLLLTALVLIFLFPIREDISISSTGFYYYVFSGTPWFFWSRFLVVLIWLRLSWLDSINIVLQKLRPTRWLSSLSWNRHFGFAYFIQFAFLPLALNWREVFLKVPVALDLFWIFILVATELSTRVITDLLKKTRQNL